MLELEVVPERSLGCDQWEFILGMHFSQAVAIIQSQVGIIKGVQVLYSDNNPLQVEIIINLPQDGIRLHFDPLCQRLKMIEVYNLKCIKLKYCGNVFNSPEIIPTLQQIEHSFGATHPGEYDEEKQLFVLNFRGLSFYHTAPKNCSISSLFFTPDNTPLAFKMSVYCGSKICMASTPELPLSCFHFQIYLKEAEAIREGSCTKGLRLKLVTSTNRRVEASKVQFEREILLGQTPQDVTVAIGAPSKVFYKSEDKMRIHRSKASQSYNMGVKCDYFFNYFSLGMDILFDARSHIAKKIILHTNYPGHYNFNIYQRCEFKFKLNGYTVTTYSRWDDIKKQLTPSDTPVVLNRAHSTNTTNPFGSTLCYGYQDIIFEIMPNNYIGSLTVYGTGRSLGSEESA